MSIFAVRLYSEVRRRLDGNVGPAWLLHFVHGGNGDNLGIKSRSLNLVWMWLNLSTFF